MRYTHQICTLQVYLRHFVKSHEQKAQIDSDASGKDPWGMNWEGYGNERMVDKTKHH